MTAEHRRNAQREAARRRKHRMIEARAKGTHTSHEWERRLGMVWNTFCPRCNRMPVDGLVKDHIKPVHLGGSDAIENLQPLCVSCNSSKGRESINWLAHFVGTLLMEGYIAPGCEPDRTDWRDVHNWNGDFPPSTGGGI